MSLVPVLVQLARELDNEHRLAGGLGDWDRFLDDDFGFGINPVDIFRPRLMAPMHQRRSALAPYLLGRRRHHHHHQRGDGNELSAPGGVGSGSLIPSVGKDGFQVSIDVSQFKPTELTVKTVDNTVVIEGKHEEREDDHGLIQRHFVRKFTLPKNYDATEVKSTISSDGVLTVKAPPPAIKDAQNERIVQIQQTGVSSKATQSIKQTQNGDNAAAGDAGNVEAAK